MQKGAMEADAAIHRVSQIGRRDPPSATGDLDEALIGRSAIAHDQRETRHTFGADQSDLDAAVAHTVGDDRYNTAVDEVVADGEMHHLDIEVVALSGEIEYHSVSF